MNEQTNEATDCIFCRIVLGVAPAHIVWEDEFHIAFLSIYPNTLGLTVVIPKAHLPSDIMGEMESKDREKLFVASTLVAKRLVAAFEDVGRVSMIVEGFGVNHAHTKLIPLHGTVGPWKRIRSGVEMNTYFDAYLGYVSSHDVEPRADDAILEDVASEIRNVKL